MCVRARVCGTGEWKWCTHWTRENRCPAYAGSHEQDPSIIYFPLLLAFLFLSPLMLPSDDPGERASLPN